VTGASPTTFAVDLGGTHLRCGVVAGDGTILAEQREPTPSSLDEIVTAIARGVHVTGRDRDVAPVVGVGAAGMIDFDGQIRFAPNVPAFRDAPVRERLADALGMRVALDNDANVAALGELAHGAARGCSEVLVITLGTGIGGGIVTRGAVLRGAHGFGAEIGHFQVDPDGPTCACGEPGHWEALASGTALGVLARDRAEKGQAPSVLALAGGDVAAVKGDHVGDAAQAGAADAVAIIEEYARRVAVGLVGLVNILDSELVVVSGGVVELGDVLMRPLREWFSGHLEGASHRPDVPIVPAALGEQAGLVGAGVLARRVLEEG
jgi:glucokinase